MPKYIVRPAVNEQAKLEGKVGANSVMVRAATPDEARRNGAELLGLSVGRVTVAEADGGDDVVVVGMDPATLRAALARRGDQETGLYDGTPEPMV